MNCKICGEPLKKKGKTEHYLIDKNLAIDKNTL